MDNINKMELYQRMLKFINLRVVKVIPTHREVTLVKGGDSVWRIDE